jgi:hypothetical protein
VTYVKGDTFGNRDSKRPAPPQDGDEIETAGEWITTRASIIDDLRTLRVRLREATSRAEQAEAALEKLRDERST